MDKAQFLHVLREAHALLSLEEPIRTQEVAHLMGLSDSSAQCFGGLCSIVTCLAGHAGEAAKREISATLREMYGGYGNPFKQFGEQYSYFADVIDWDFRRDKLVEIIAHVERQELVTTRDKAYF